MSSLRIIARRWILLFLGMTMTAGPTVRAADSAAFGAPYLLDQRDELVGAGSGGCVRTGFWTADLAARSRLPGAEFPAGCTCDRDLMPAGVCERPAVAKPPPPPKPAPKPEAKPKPKPKPIIQQFQEKTAVNFNFEDARLASKGAADLTAFMGNLQGAHIEAVIVTGHADRLEMGGNAKRAATLSSQRADAVRKHLTAAGVDPRIIFWEARGATRPALPAGACVGKARTPATIKCLQPDRRVEIEVAGSRTIKSKPAASAPECRSRCDEEAAACARIADTVHRDCLAARPAEHLVCDSRLNDMRFRCDAQIPACKANCN